MPFVFLLLHNFIVYSQLRRRFMISSELLLTGNVIFAWKNACKVSYTIWPGLIQWSSPRL